MVQGERLLVLNATSERDIDSAFSTLQEQEAGGLLVQSGPLFTAKREKIVALATRYAVPTIYAQREFVDVGGLMSYGVNFLEIYGQLGVYTGRMLKGEKPADLPVMQPTKFEFVINLKTVKALLARSRHELVHRTCPLSGVKRTCRFAPHMSANDDPKQTLAEIPLMAILTQSGHGLASNNVRVYWR
jgi:ABC-type uncharacterized transport system substrate-binding protein